MADGFTRTYEWAQKHARIKNEYVRETISEFLGTMLLLFFVNGSSLHTLIFKLIEGGRDSHVVEILGMALGIMIAVIIFGGVSGAHINPAISLGLALAGRLKWAKLPFYITAQMLGAYIGSMAVFVLHLDQLRYRLPLLGNEVIMHKNPIDIIQWDRENGGEIASTLSPSGNNTYLLPAFATEVILTAILCMVIMGVTDKGNMKVPVYLIPFYIAFSVAPMSMILNLPSGTMLNPARDFAPRLVLKTFGWPNDLCFQSRNFSGQQQEWWIIGIFGSPVGAILGTLLYNFTVGAQLTEIVTDDEPQPKSKPKIPTSVNGDWRSTVFIPRTGSMVKSHPNVPYVENMGPLPQSPQMKDINYNNNNPPFIREDMRYRDGYY